MTRNVVLICLDCVRKDRFDQFAPRLRGLSNIEYEECRALSSWSAPSHASMFTGQLPSQHGVHSHDFRLGTLAREETFLAALEGYTAMGISANPFACSYFGFDTLFDRWHDVQPELPFSEAMNVKQASWRSETSGLALYRSLLRDALDHQLPGRSVANALTLGIRNAAPTLPVPTFRDDGAREIVAQSEQFLRQTTEPFFLFTNFMEAHQPFQQRWYHDTDIYDAPNSWSFDGSDKSRVNASGGLTDEQERAHYRGLYETSIEYLDRVVSEFVTQLQEETDRETAVIVTADHGENLGYDCEDNLVDHMATLSEGVLHVPLNVILPETESCQTVEEYVSHRHLGALIERLAAGEPAPDITVERPKAEIVGGGEAQNQLDPSHDSYRYLTRMQRCVYENEQKYRWDSLETGSVSVLDRGPSLERTTRETFDSTNYDTSYFDQPIEEFKRSVANGETDRQVTARLRDLGYA